MVAAAAPMLHPGYRYGPGAVLPYTGFTGFLMRLRDFFNVIFFMVGAFYGLRHLFEVSFTVNQTSQSN